MPRRFVSPKSSTILDFAKSLLCKVSSLIRFLFDTEAHNFACDDDLKKMDGEALTLGAFKLSASWLQTSWLLLSLLGLIGKMNFLWREVEMVKTQRRTRIPCSLVHSNLSPNSNQSVVGDALLGISESLLQNLFKPNLSTKTAQVVLLLLH